LICTDDFKGIIALVDHEGFEENIQFYQAQGIEYTSGGQTYKQGIVTRHVFLRMSEALLEPHSSFREFVVGKME
jgi:hypothetical protein